jgi:hypothetical protein
LRPDVRLCANLVALANVGGAVDRGSGQKEHGLVGWKS